MLSPNGKDEDGYDIHRFMLLDKHNKMFII